MRLVAALIALTLVSMPVAAFAETAPRDAPRASITSLSELATPLPYPYDEHADAAAALDAAFARATANHKRVLVVFGGNWCGDCRVLAGVMALPEVASFVRQNYEVVKIDVGRMNKNLDLAHRLGVEQLHGVPTVVVATADGHPVNVTNSAELTDARSMTPQGIADYLARFAD